MSRLPRADAPVRGWRRWAFVVLAAFCSGAVTDGWLVLRLARRAPHRPVPIATHVPVCSHPPAMPSRADAGGAVEALRARHLQLPVARADVEAWKGSFAEPRQGHAHAAVDILAPRGTPVHAVDAGTIAKLADSRLGGLSIYQFDPSHLFVYYYAHLDRYAENLHDGDAVAEGQVIGYVGTTGNAPPNTPHLHFATSVLGAGERWWQGRAIDPYLVFERQ